jgi:hypothetical protein
MTTVSFTPRISRKLQRSARRTEHLRRLLLRIIERETGEAHQEATR